jgi:hypothetical protein
MSKATGDGREALLRRKDAWIWTDARSATGCGGKSGGLWTRLVGDKPNSIGRSSADPRRGKDESLKISPRRSSTDTVKADHRIATRADWSVRPPNVPRTLKQPPFDARTLLKAAKNRRNKN